MIESKEQLVSRFQQLAGEFVDSGSAVKGIDLDDAVVALKRYALSVMKDEGLGNLLGKFRNPIREGDTGEIQALTDEVMVYFE